MSKSLDSRVYEGADIIDTRDIIERIAELKAEQESAGEDFTEQDELDKLLALEDAGITEWHDGAALIADGYFEQYAQDMAEDIGNISRDAAWPANHIDWKAAAEELQQDYSSVEYGSTTYFYRG